jgi:hypothetical protein
MIDPRQAIALEIDMNGFLGLLFAFEIGDMQELRAADHSACIS